MSLPENKTRSVTALLADIRYMAESFEVTENHDVNLVSCGKLLHKVKCLRRILKAYERGDYEIDEQVNERR